MTTCNGCGQPMNAGTSTMCPECIRDMREDDYYANEPADDLSESSPVAVGQGKRLDQFEFSVRVLAVLGCLAALGVIGFCIGALFANLTTP